MISPGPTRPVSMPGLRMSRKMPIPYPEDDGHDHEHNHDHKHVNMHLQCYEVQIFLIGILWYEFPIRAYELLGYNMCIIVQY